MDFGAFVEVMPGVEGLIHVSEMSWTKRIQRPSDVLKNGERVEAVVLKMDERGRALESRAEAGSGKSVGHHQGSIPERKDRRRQGHPTRQVRRIRGSGGGHRRPGPHFRIHQREAHPEHPGEVVKVGQVVRAVVLSAEPETKRLKLGMKQLEATAADQFAQEAAVGDRVTRPRLAGSRQQGDGAVGRRRRRRVSRSTKCAGRARPSCRRRIAGGTVGGGMEGRREIRAGPSSEPYREGQVRSFTIKAMDASGERKSN